VGSIFSPYISKVKTAGLRPAPRKLFGKSLTKNFGKNREKRAIFGWVLCRNLFVLCPVCYLEIAELAEVFGVVCNKNIFMNYAECGN